MRPYKVIFFECDKSQNILKMRKRSCIIVSFICTSRQLLCCFSCNNTLTSLGNCRWSQVQGQKSRQRVQSIGGPNIEGPNLKVDRFVIVLTGTNFSLRRKSNHFFEQVLQNSDLKSIYGKITVRRLFCVRPTKIRRSLER